MWPYLSLFFFLALIALHFCWRKRFILARQSFNQEISKLNQEIAKATTQQHQFAAQSSAEQEALFNSMIEGVLVLDQNARILLANRALENLFGLSGDISGKTIMETLRVHELAALVSRLSKEKQILGFEINLPGIEQRIVEVNAAAVIGRDGQQKGTILVCHDLTRLKILENTRQEFVANVSHELRTPLSLIKGYVETLIDGAKDKPEVASRFLEIIERNVNRLNFLIEDLLTISKLESGQTLLNFSEVNLYSVVERIIEDLQSRADQKKVRLTNNLPNELSARADADRLQQVLSNLVDNAIKYGQSEGAVVISGKLLSDGKIEMSVQDDGPGIPADAIERVFERFYRVDKARSREQGGTGLGLSIVKHIVQSHGGKVWANSEPGKGSTFYFTLDTE